MASRATWLVLLLGVAVVAAWSAAQESKSTPNAAAQPEAGPGATKDKGGDEDEGGTTAGVAAAEEEAIIGAAKGFMELLHAGKPLEAFDKHASWEAFCVLGFSAADYRELSASQRRYLAGLFEVALKANLSEGKTLERLRAMRTDGFKLASVRGSWATVACSTREGDGEVREYKVRLWKARDAWRVAASGRPGKLVTDQIRAKWDTLKQGLAERAGSAEAKHAMLIGVAEGFCATTLTQKAGLSGKGTEARAGE